MRGFDTAQRSYERMLAAGPPEPASFTVDFDAEVFAEGPFASPAEVETWLREQLGPAATIRRVEDEETARFTVNDELEDVTDEDDARDALDALITGGPHEMALDGVEIHIPELDEPDWDAIDKDRRLEAELDFD